MLDADLSRIYGVTTARLNQQVKRNQNRFPEPHKILQAVMDWETRHLHEFVVGREHIGEPDPEFGCAALAISVPRTLGGEPREELLRL